MINYFENTMRILEKAVESLNQTDWDNTIKKCTEVVKNGGKIIASGLGKNVPICEKFVGTLNSFGIPAYFLHTNTAIHGDLGIVTEKDYVFLLSKSGNTVESIILADYLLERTENVCLMSCNKNSKLAETLPNSINLDLEHEGDLWNIAPNNSTTAFLIILQGIAVTLSETLNVQLQDFKKNHPGGSIGEKLRKV